MRYELNLDGVGKKELSELAAKATPNGDAVTKLRQALEEKLQNLDLSSLVYCKDTEEYELPIYRPDPDSARQQMIPDTITQAVERLRRVNSSPDWDHITDIYPDAYYREGDLAVIDAINSDNKTLADFLLSIWPKGDRPAAMEQPSECCARGSFDAPGADKVAAWAVDADESDEDPVFAVNCHCLSCWTKETFRLQFYPTEAAARLELQWRKVLELVAMAEASPKPESKEDK